jgi:hypothetical protein
MKIGDWIKFDSTYSSVSYFIKVSLINKNGIFGDFTFKSGVGKDGKSPTFIPLVKDGLFPWIDMKTITVLKKSKRLDCLN